MSNFQTRFQIYSPGSSYLFPFFHFAILPFVRLSTVDLTVVCSRLPLFPPANQPISQQASPSIGYCLCDHVLRQVNERDVITCHAGMQGAQGGRAASCGQTASRRQENSPRQTLVPCPPIRRRANTTSTPYARS
ncbi:unnamed protein product [Protopolystoma xenopodis]|uniref:Uncharacterized protein n=1 Tax=Protopolystoma xenopodis TaxID=117903 RepID=A0A3S5B3W8_9PLAT|nr:unnamed protein product [Protopolystoma xenopodis]